MSSVADYIGSALNAGDGAVAICTPEHHDALEGRLRANRVDVEGAERQGRYIALDAAATLAAFMREGWPDGVTFHNVIGNLIAKARSSAGSSSQVAAFGEMVSVLWAANMQDAAIRVEALWNSLARMQDFRLRCAYPVRFFEDEKRCGDLLRICGEHSHVVPSGEEDASFGMWEMELTTEQCMLTYAASRLLGLPAGKTEVSALLQKMYYSGDREQFETAIRSANTRNKSIAMEFRVADPDGSVRFLACQGRTFMNHGRPIMLGVLMDVTAHRSAIYDKLWPNEFGVS